MTDRLIARPPDLPVAAGLADIAAQTGNVVVTAPPGSGKTTLVPPLFAKILADDAVGSASPGVLAGVVGVDRNAGGDGTTAAGAAASGAAGAAGRKVIVVQPRRVAARAAARRIAALIGEPVGRQVGFRVRGETKPGTRIEMVTPGVVLRMLHAEPDLPGVGALIIDEIHERDLDTDLVTAFALDVQETLRPDLRIVAMSATLAAEQVAELIGGTVVDVPGAIHPVEVTEKLGPRALGDVGYGITVTREFLAHVAGVVREAAARPGSTLVFLPGVGEINRVRQLLAGAPLPVMALHGQLSSRDQDAVLGSAEDRIILATAVAESSLTVPGVRTVVDSCLAREPRFDPRTGISELVTVHASRARMTQRAGRAGREGLGRAYRCLAFAPAAEFSEPEILCADVTDVLLQSAAWGNPRMDGLRLLDRPRPAAVDAAERTLRGLGAIDDDGAITAAGRALVDVPASPQLARGLIAGARAVGVDTAAGVIALLNLGVRAAGSDLAAELRGAGKNREWTAEKRRLATIATEHLGAERLGAEHLSAEAGAEHSGAGKRNTQGASLASQDEAIADVVARAYPTWIARRRGRGYLLANGAGATLPDGSPLEGSPWLAVAELSGGQGRADAVIRAAVPIEQDAALEAGADMLTERLEVEVAGTKVTGRTVRSLGAIEIASAPAKLTRQQVARARADDIANRGIGTLDWSESATRLRERMAFVRDVVGDPWPDVSDTGLAQRVDEWLTPQLGAACPDLVAGLRALLPWPEAANFDELAPERIATPMGTAKVDYSSGKPTVRLRIQEAFGWARTPELACVPVTLELLSPAQRPLAITDDLASFWAGPYKDVRADMRGRYPRHPWPEDPLRAEPTRRANKKRPRGT
ncbi:ATP-dependent helicase HrpB [Trueperella bialowiezensis]|uniref:RNA helicase n=1 Tax=Trueperella bialowiezensis TaxID=312285 RepID=A0A448PEB3_9ACTO|nr:ATP-dependent helicase HrpB [Trueperella bialowiezensis]VEI13277.1 ATP-dependent RNA helicase HrpB [Trueperella bialowiezensis]